MFLIVLDMEGKYAGHINLDKVDMIKLIESGQPTPNRIQVWGLGGLKDFKISKSAYQQLQRYLDRDGIV